MSSDSKKPNRVDEMKGSQTTPYGVQLPSVAPQNANLLPGGTANTAGGKAKEAGFFDAAKAIELDDFKQVHKKPCVRDALMTGIVSGFAAGGLRAIIGASVLTASNWAVGVFCAGSFVTYEYCQRKRMLEKQAMQRVVSVLDRKSAEKRQMMQDAKAAGEARSLEAEAKKS